MTTTLLAAEADALYQLPPVISPKGTAWVLVDDLHTVIGPSAPMVQDPITGELVVGGLPLTIGIRAGFETDLATIPTWARWAIDPADPLIARASIVHDWLLYLGWEQRAAAGVFYLELRRAGVPTWRAQMMFYAVLAASSDW